MRLTLPGSLPLALSFALVGCGAAVDRADDVAIALHFTPPPHVGEVHCTVTLSDASGAPVAGADLELEGNMNHAGMVPVFATPVEVEDGRYETPIEFTMGGDWLVFVRGTLADGRVLDRVLPVDGVPSGGAPDDCCTATVEG